ncbi:SIR2 family protein [Vibrio tubiashii]|uniref:SIR2 family protein n=1 Tax=Vibrio tubiashii TaxID=29498 RepID=UPI001EFE54A3|nr:SIR2 family protein [Vibrio tubiashii]MCG9583726.1 SIR2 family protein [Vibrio tubiashii]MCG9617304.1 SIR2 family protein [Vibrio tubiashii]MCG9689822.1 SIR2 family protein [Vibrio tubiashii]
MRDYVVIVGNDINNIVAGKSWGDLLNKLTSHLSISVDFLHDKPFPLAYEEIYFKGLDTSDSFDERVVKKFVATHVSDIESSTIHERLMTLGCENILTTNYDLSLESVQSSNTKSLKNNGYIKESLYSLFRYHEVGHKKVWHIHGSANAYQSITLGYEHYSGYLQHMRSYVVTGTKDTYKRRSFPPLTKRFKDDEVEHLSWVDMFFTKDVHILGLSLDFNETDLWWLLTFRQKSKHTKRLLIFNQVYYYIPKAYVDSSKSKLDLLKSVGVQIVEIDDSRLDKLGYYNCVIDRISEKYT